MASRCFINISSGKLNQLLQQTQTMDQKLAKLTTALGNLQSKIEARSAPRVDSAVATLASLSGLQATAAGVQPVAAATAAAATAAVAATSSLAASRETSAPAAAREDGRGDACPGRSPFHTLLTSQASVYQQWQARIMYFHWRKQKVAGGVCTDMAG